jgi:tyrosinase
MKQKLTRRRFLRAAGAAASAAVIVPPLFDFERLASAAPLMRRNIASLTTLSSDVVAYRKAIKAMRALPDTNPLSWGYQAAIHGTTLAGSHTAWNTCEHHTFFFWSWHRMYLYWFERIARKMSGTKTFALPYWNYSASAAQRKLPALFRNSSNILFMADRDANMNDGTGSLPAGWVDITGGMAETDFGDAQDSLESTPHDLVHVGVGGGMGDVDTAALDPVFYIHHANLDRLWNTWLAQGGGRSDPLGGSAQDAAWRTNKYTFFDENGAEVKMTGCQVMRAAQQLNYTYQGEPAQVNQFCKLIIPRFVFQKELVFRLPIPPVTLREERVSFPVEVRQVRDRLRRVAQSRTETLVLDLEDVTAERPPGVAFEVYVGLPEGAEPDPSSPHFVGQFALFSTGVRSRSHHGSKPARFSFRANRAVAAALARNEDRLDVTIVPRGIDVGGRRSQARPAAEVRLGAASFSVKRQRRQ